MSLQEIQDALRLEDRESFRKLYLAPAIVAACIERAIPDKPNSRLQKHLHTDKGHSLLDSSMKKVSKTGPFSLELQEVKYAKSKHPLTTPACPRQKGPNV